MKRYFILALISLPIGFSIGHLTSSKRTPAASHTHSYGAWRSSGQTGGLGRTRLIQERRCYVCGNIDTKLSD